MQVGEDEIDHHMLLFEEVRQAPEKFVHNTACTLFHRSQSVHVHLQDE